VTGGLTRRLILIAPESEGLRPVRGLGGVPPAGPGASSGLRADLDRAVEAVELAAMPGVQRVRDGGPPP
jgi:hypothetical protein